MSDAHAIETCQVSPRPNKKDAALTTSLFVSFPTLFNCSPQTLTNLQPAEIVVQFDAFHHLRFHLQPAEIVVQFETFGFDDLGFISACSYGNLGFFGSVRISELLTSL